MPTPEDPLAEGIAPYGQRLRASETTAEDVTRAYLDRIAALDSDLGAYQHVANDTALAHARAIDALLKSGVDLGPLMGVPVAVKDLVAVDGMPTTAGSKLDVADLIGGEGRFVRKLKRLGCVVLGKTKTVEFAFGVTGASTPQGTPRNPSDADTPRLPGGSSAGSAVAMVAGLCGFAIGSDTWIALTAAIVAPPIAAFEDPERAMTLTLEMTQNSQPANYLNLSAATIPLRGGNAPVGLQLICSPRSERRLLAICCAIETALGASS